MAVLEWTLSNTLSRYPQLLQNISVSIVPDSEVEMLLIRNTSVRLTLLYNTPYNVSIIIQPVTCERLRQAAFIVLNYSKFNVIEYHSNVSSKYCHVYRQVF